MPPVGCPAVMVGAMRRGWRPTVRVRRTDARFYDAFRRFHYLGSGPAVAARVLGAWVDGEPAGVLVTSRPVLNGRWRAVAWPGVFDGPDKRVNAQRVNALLRTIARVVIDPRYRGLGLAAQLVRAYLRRPETIYTEALAAMGQASPFFERGGMTRLAHTTTQPERRLAAELQGLRVEPRRLLVVRVPRADHAVARWASSSGGRRGHGTTPAERARAAGRALVCPPVAYAATAPSQTLADRPGGRADREHRNQGDSDRAHGQANDGRPARGMAQ
ncbi:MAG: hypothetical protein AAF108_08520 [Planctomycetota bacterium]